MNDEKNDELKNGEELEEAPEPLFKTDQSDIEEPEMPDVPEDESDIAQSPSQRVTITIGRGVPNTANRTVTWPITLSHSVLMGLTDGDIVSRSPSNAQVGISITGTTGTITFSGIPANTSGTAGFVIRANAFDSNSLPANFDNNAAIAAPNTSYDFIGRPARISISTRRHPPARSVWWYVTAGPGFNLDDIINRNPSNATVTLSGSGRDYIVTFTMPVGTGGVAYFTVRANALDESSLGSGVLNNVAVTSNRQSFSFPATPPATTPTRVTITIARPTINNTDRTISWPVTFSHSILMGLTDADIINRSPSNVMIGITGSGANRTITFSGFPANATGTAGFTIRDFAFDSNSLPSNHVNNIAVDAPNTSYDFRPANNIIWSIPSELQTGAFTVSGVWSQALTRSSFTASDITVSSGTVSNFTFNSNNRDFSFRVTPPANTSGNITVTIAANAVTPTNTAPQTTLISYDTIRRVATTITAQTPNQAERTISWLITFNPVIRGTGLVRSNLIPDSTSFTVENFSGITRVTQSGFLPGQSGSSSFTLRADSIISRFLPTNYANNLETPSPVLNYNFSIQGPTVANWFVPNEIQKNRFFTVEVVFDSIIRIRSLSRTGNQFLDNRASASNEDFTIEGTGSLGVTFGEITGTPREPLSSTDFARFLIPITLPAESSGIFNLVLNRNAVGTAVQTGFRFGPAERQQSPSIQYDTRTAIPEDEISVEWSTPEGIQTGESFNITANFGQFVQGLEKTDLNIIGTSGATIAIFAETYIITVSGAVIPTSIAGTNVRINQSKFSGVVSPVSRNSQVPNTTNQFYLLLNRAIDADTLLPGDITFAGTASGLTTTAVDDRDNIYRIQVTPPANQTGPISLLLDKDKVTDDEGTTGPSVESYSPSVLFDTRTVVERITAEQPRGVQIARLRNGINHFKIRFNRELPTSTFTASNIITSFAVVGATATIGTPSRSTTDTQEWFIPVTMPASPASGTVLFRVLENAGTLSSLRSFSSDIYPWGEVVEASDSPSAEFTVPSGIQTGTSFDINADFTGHVTGLTTNDFTITGITGASFVIMSEQFRLTLRATSGNTLPSRLTPSNITINQTKFPGLDAQGTITRQGTSANYNLVLNRAIDISSLLVGDITINNLTGISASAVATEDNIYRIRVTPPTNSQGTLSLILDRNAVTNFDGVQGPLIEQTTPSTPFDTRTEILSIVPQQPAGTDIAQLQNGINHWLITFNRTLPANTFNASNAATSFTIVSSSGSTTFGTPIRGTDTTTWLVPVTYPSAGSGDTYFQFNNNTGLSICEFRSDTYQFGMVAAPTDQLEIGPSIERWVIPEGVQDGSFNVDAIFSEDVNLRTSSQTGSDRLDNRASASNQDFTVTGTGSEGVTFGTIVPVAGNVNRRFRLAMTLPANSSGTFSITLARNAVSKTSDTTVLGPVETMQSPPIEYSTVAVQPMGPDPSADFTVPTAVQTGTTFDITADFTVHVIGLDASDFTITGVSGGSLIVMSEQFRLTLSGTTLPARLTPSQVTISQTRHSGVVAQGTITRQGTSGNYNLVLNRAVDIATLVSSDITLSGVTGVTVSSLVAEDNNYRIRVTPPTNTQGTLSLILDKNAVTNFSGLTGPSIEQNTPSIPFNTRTEVVSIVPQQPRGVDIAELAAGINHYLIRFNRVLPTTTFTAANRNTDFSVITSAGTATIGTPSRSTTDTQEWFIPVTYPTGTYGSTYFQLNSNAGSLSICEHRSDTYQFGTIDLPDFQAGPSITDWTIPEGTQDSAFNIDVLFSEDVTLRTSSQTGATTLDNRASASNEDFTIEGTGATGVSFGTITASTESGLGNRKFRIPVTLPATSEGIFSLTLARNAVARPSDTDVTGPIEIQTSPAIEYDTTTPPPPPRGTGPSADFTVPTAIQTGTTFDIMADFSPAIVTGLTASDFTITGVSGGSLIVMSEQFQIRLQAAGGATLPTRLTPSNVTIDQTKFSGVVAQGTITRQETSDRYNLVLNEAVDVSTLLVSDLTINNLTGISVIAVTAQDNNYRIRVTPPTNTAATLSLILDRSSVLDAAGDRGPLIEQNTPSVPFDTRTVILSVVPQQPRGTDIAELQNGINHWHIVFNRTLPTTQFTAANKDTDFTVTTSEGTVTIGTPERLSTTTEWIVPTTFPASGYGSAFFQVNSNAGSLSLCEFRSDIYQFGAIAAPSANTGITYGTPIVDNVNRQVTIPMTFSNIGNGLEASDFTISATNGTWTALLTSGAGSDARILTLNEGTQAALAGSLTVAVAEDAFTDRVITGNAAARTSETASYTLGAKTTTVTFGSPNVDNTARTVTIPVTFSNVGQGLEASDFTINASSGTWRAELTAGTGGSNTRTLTLYNTDQGSLSGSITATISANAFTDRIVTGNSAARTSTSAPYNLRAITGSTVVIRQDRTATIRNGQRFFVWFDWSTDVTGFTTDDVSISAGTKGSFSGSGRRYKLFITAPETGGQLVVTVRRNAVNQSNDATRHSIGLGTGATAATVLESTSIIGTGLTYTPGNLYTISPQDVTIGTLRTYTLAGVLTTTSTFTTTGLVTSRPYQGRAIEVLNGNFIIGAFQFDRIGITRANYKVPNAQVNDLFIDIDRWTGFSSRDDGAILDLAVSNDQIFALSYSGSTGSDDLPRYEINIYRLDGTNRGSISIDLETAGTEFYNAVPSCIVATQNYLYLGFTSLRSLVDASVQSGSTLFAYTLDGVREPKEDILLGDLSGSQTRYGITSADWDETNDRFFLLVDRNRVIQNVNYPWLATLTAEQPVDAAWSTIAPVTLEAGDTFDVKPYAGSIDSIYWGIGADIPEWLSLNNGVITVASSGLPSTNTTTNVSLLGIGSGNPAYVNFDLNLRREAPTWNLPASFTRDAGETIDLNQFVTDAETISLRSGYPNPLGLSINNGIITLPLVQQQVPTTVNVTGTNPVDASHAEFSLLINHEATDLRNLSFQQTVPAWTVLINGVDLSDDVLSVNNVLHSWDLYDTGQFTVAEATIDIDNRNRLYQRNGAFYADNNINPFEAEIVVIGEFSGIRRRMFIGTVLGINENINEQAVTLLCVEAARHLRTQQVMDFGIPKYNVHLGAGQSGFEGNYPLPDGLTPSSDGSLVGFSEGLPLTVVGNQALRVYGDLNPSNVKQTDTTVNSEGGLLETEPVVDLKSAPLYQRVSQYLVDLLRNEGITYFNVEVPGLSATEPFFESVGRVGYNEEPTDVQRYAKDWILDRTNKVFYVLAGSPNVIEQDYLWQWTPATDEWVLLYQFESDQEMWQIQSNDYDNFYILGTEAREDLRIIPNATYDASETETGSASKVNIWRYTRSSNSFSVFVGSDNNYPPTLAHFYSVGFPRENANSDRYGKLPDTRGGFILLGAQLYYRYASGSDCGVAIAFLAGGTGSRISVGNPDNFGNAAGIALTTTTDNRFVYAGYTVAPSDPAQLRIVRQNTRGGTVTTLGTLNDPIDNSYAFTGVLEIFTTRSTVYFVAQRQPRETEAPYRRDETANASAVLYSMPYNGGTPTVLKEYDYVQTAARSFVEHNGNVHFFEGSHVGYTYEPADPKWRGQIGRVQRISGSEIQEVGLAWRTELVNLLDTSDPYYGIHGGMCSPMHSLDDKLYLIAAYGDYNLVSESGSEINKAYNDAIVVLSNEVELRLPTIETNRKTGYNVLNEIALSTNSIYGVDHQKFFWASRANLSATLSATISNTDTSISLINRTGSFPLSGYLRIGSEIIEYGGLSTNPITVTARGIAGTLPAAHSASDSVLYVHHVIFASGPTSPLRNMTINDDYTNLYNSIFVSYGADQATYHVEDQDSIQQYGRREFTIDTLLHFTQAEWAKSVGDNYLATFKNLEQILNFESDLALFLSVGDVIYLETKEITAACRIYELEHDFDQRSTNVSARTISEEAPAAFFTDSTWGTGVWGTFTWGVSR